MLMPDAYLHVVSADDRSRLQTPHVVRAELREDSQNEKVESVIYVIKQ
jgi:hypothetical protein